MTKTVRGVAILQDCPEDKYRGKVWITNYKYCDKAGKCSNFRCRYNREKEEESN
jgi:hypothetical protein